MLISRGEYMMLARSACLALATVCVFASVPAVAAPHRTTNASARTDDDHAVRADIMKRVERLLKTEDFAALNKMAADFRTTRARTPSGMWKLRIFHLSVRYYLAQNQPDGECVSSAGPMLTRWLAVDPAAPAPIITQASNLLEQAWCKRDDPASGFDAFLADASQADQWLAAHKVSASVDPEYYAIAEDIGFVTRHDKANFDGLLAEGISREPGYYDLYISAMKYYLPSAFGSKDDVDRIARLAMQKIGSSDDAGGYARVYWAYVDCGCEIWQSSVDWPLMKRSMADVVARYPADWNIVNFAKISCQVGDGIEAAKYLRKLKIDNGVAWASGEERDRCFAMAGLRGARTATR
jgi:hypothetical protein